MLAFITTDAAVEPSVLQQMLTSAVDQSFNRITVDGDQSTNDTVLILANGASGAVLERTDATGFGAFVTALNEICFELAMMIVRDGEGADRFVTVVVDGAQSIDEADLAARAVANSLLNKTAWAGTYPDWGRIMDAIGYAAAQVDEERVNIYYGNTQAVEGGIQAATSMEEMVKAVSEKELLIRIELGLGVGKCDGVYLQLYRGVCTDQCVRVNMNTFIEKAAVLTEALPFIQQFRGETVVVKFGGSIMENEAGVRNISDRPLAECVGMHPVVVHGGVRQSGKHYVMQEFILSLSKVYV